MARITTTYNVLLISPSDVERERDALTDLVNQWNAQAGRALGASIDLVRWESHATPDLSAPAQQIINRDLVDDCDLGIALFWYRIGTATEQHPSGSIEEIYRLLDKGVRVMAYFSAQAIPQEGLKDDQYTRLKEAKERLYELGMAATFKDIPHLREKVNLHLTKVITEFVLQQRAEPGDMTALGNQPPTEPAREAKAEIMFNTPEGPVQSLPVSVEKIVEVPAESHFIAREKIQIAPLSRRESTSRYGNLAIPAHFAGIFDVSEDRLDHYLTRDFTNYVRERETFILGKHQLIELRPVIINDGTLPAGQVQIVIDFSPIGKVIDEDEIPARPKRPDRPTPDQLRSIFADDKYLWGLSPSLPTTPPARRESSPAKQNGSVLEWKIAHLHHKRTFNLDPVYILVQIQDGEKYTVQVQYAIHANEFIEPKEGVLNLLVDVETLKWDEALELDAEEECQET